MASKLQVHFTLIIALVSQSCHPWLPYPGSWIARGPRNCISRDRRGHAPIPSTGFPATVTNTVGQLAATLIFAPPPSFSRYGFRSHPWQCACSVYHLPTGTSILHVQTHPYTVPFALIYSRYTDTPTKLFVSIISLEGRPCANNAEKPLWALITTFILRLHTMGHSTLSHSASHAGALSKDNANLKVNSSGYS
jgi:hypothetical protein